MPTPTQVYRGVDRRGQGEPALRELLYLLHDPVGVVLQSFDNGVEPLGADDPDKLDG